MLWACSRSLLYPGRAAASVAAIAPPTSSPARLKRSRWLAASASAPPRRRPPVGRPRASFGRRFLTRQGFCCRSKPSGRRRLQSEAMKAAKKATRSTPTAQSSSGANCPAVGSMYVACISRPTGCTIAPPPSRSRVVHDEAISPVAGTGDARKGHARRTLRANPARLRLQRCIERRDGGRNVVRDERCDIRRRVRPQAALNSRRSQCR